MANPKKTKTEAKKTSPAPAVKAAELALLGGELRQLAEIRAHFAALSPDEAAALLLHHHAEACRAKGGNTRALEIFRGGLSWARTFSEHRDDAALSQSRVRWFLDCLTALGALLSGRATAKNPADESAYDDASKAADKLLRRTLRRVRDAAGTDNASHAAIDEAGVVADALDARLAQLTQLAALLKKWLAAAKLPLASYGVTAATVTALTAAAKALEDAIAKRPAAGQADHDGPAVNEAEGRLLYVMRPLWDDLAEAREDGLTSLQLTVTPSLLRGLDLRARKGSGKKG